MKRNEGNAALIALLVVVLAIVVTAGILYVQLYYLPHLKPVAIAPTSNSSTAAPMVPATPSTTAATTTSSVSSLKNCSAGDFSCMIAAAATCSPASLEFSGTVNVFNEFIQTSQIHFVLDGFNAAHACAFSDREDAITLAWTTSTIQEAKANGVTNAQLQQQLQESQAEATQESVGLMVNCAMPTSTLAQVLTRWSKGDESSNDLVSGNCISTSPSGVTSTVSTG